MNELIFFLRDSLNSSLSSRRLYHGRGKFILNFEHLNIELFYPYLVVVFYRPFETDLLLHAIKELVLKNPDYKIKGIVVQSRFLMKSPSYILWGEVPRKDDILIDDLCYEISLLENQNFGFFLDMELGRNFVRKHARDKRILNLFSYTSSLSLIATQAGAKSVVNFDMSKSAHATAKENYKKNNISMNTVKFFSHDILKSFKKIKDNGPYDFIIIDPPSIQSNSFNLETDYKKIFNRVLESLEKDGLVMTSLNSPFKSFEFLRELGHDYKDRIFIYTEFGFPDYFNETDINFGLKVVVWKKK